MSGTHTVQRDFSTGGKLAAGGVFLSDKGETIILLRQTDYGFRWACAMTMFLGSTLGYKDATPVRLDDREIREMKCIGQISEK